MGLTEERRKELTEVSYVDDLREGCEPQDVVRAADKDKAELLAALAEAERGREEIRKEAIGSLVWNGSLVNHAQASEQTAWKKVVEVEARLRELEEQNARLRVVIVEAALSLLGGGKE